MFHQEARTYIDKITRVRRRLISEDRSRSKVAATSLELVENYLANYPCENNRHMATFVTNHHHHLLNIIPGSNSKSSNKLHAELTELLDAAQTILNSNNNMTLQISQGKPKNPFFSIAQPHNGINGRISLDKGKEKTLVECKHPRTGAITMAELHDLITCKLTDIPEGLSLLSYGLPSEKLIPLLLDKYPELKTNPEVEFLLLKRK